MAEPGRARPRIESVACERSLGRRVSRTWCHCCCSGASRSSWRGRREPAPCWPAGAHPGPRLGPVAAASRRRPPRRRRGPRGPYRPSSARGPSSWAPRLAVKLVPFGVFGLAVFGVSLASTYREGHTEPGPVPVRPAGPGAWGTGRSGAGRAVMGSGCGCCGGWTRRAQGWSGHCPPGGLTVVAAGSPPPPGLLLIPVAGLAMQPLGPGHWFDMQAVDGLDAAVIDLVRHGGVCAGLPGAGVGGDAGRGGPARSSAPTAG